MTKRSVIRKPCIRLNVKIGRNFVYLDKEDIVLRKGPLGAAMRPVDMAMSIEDKAERRNFRKALHACDPHLAALTVPAKPISERRAKQLLDDVTAGREFDYREDSFFHPTFSHPGASDYNR